MAADKESVSARAAPGRGASAACGRRRCTAGLFLAVIVVLTALASPRGASAEAGAVARARPARRAPKTKRPNPPAEKPPEVPPLEGDALLEGARALFAAIALNKPELADSFFFPREPFLPLKDVDDPGRYHAELVRVYHRDIQRLHARRRSWEGARFVGFRLGSAPRWIEPGREWNKIGYYRTFDARLDYEVAGKTRQILVRTIISWEGRWYVTHLSPTKH